MAEDVEQHIRCAAMGHPVFGIDDQRLANEGEQLLYCLDQLDPENGRRRNHDHGILADDLLLKLGQRLPVKQARGPGAVHFAAPATGASIQHHDPRRRLQRIVPALEIQQSIDQFILPGRVKYAALLCR